jgi:LppX_LprAFG lipoprotein
MRLVAGLALLGAVLAGCGSTTAASLEDATESTAAETSRVEMVYRVGAYETEKGYVFKASGLFDFPGQRAILTTSDSFPFYGEDVDLTEVRLIGRAAYFRWVVRGDTHWVKQDPAEKSGDPAELLLPGPGTPTKPTDVLTRVLLASEENEELGTEDVRGEETTHYRARVDLAKVVKQLPVDERPQEDVAGIWGAAVVPVDIWIDSESRLRRISLTRVGSDERPEVATTLELYDYGVEVDVQPPPEHELISEDEFDELVGPLLTADESSGEAEYCDSPDSKNADDPCPEAATP